MKKFFYESVLFCSALSRLFKHVPMLVVMLIALSSCAEERTNFTEIVPEPEFIYDVKTLEVDATVENELANSVITFDQLATCINTQTKRTSEFIPVAYFNVTLSKETIEVETEEELPLELVDSKTISSTPVETDDEKGEDIIMSFEFSDGQVATASFGYRFKKETVNNKTVYTPHIEFSDVVFKDYSIEKNGETTETEDPYKVTLNFKVSYEDKETTTEPKSYTMIASPWYNKVITTEPTVIESVTYDGKYTGNPVEAYEVTETVITNKSTFKNTYRVSLTHSFNAPQKREQPTSDSKFNDKSTGTTDENIASETKNLDGFTIRTITGSHTSTNTGKENKTIVESTATFSYETPIKLETEYGTHNIEPLSVTFKEDKFTITETSNTETLITYQTYNYIIPTIVVPNSEDSVFSALKEDVILKQTIELPEVVITNIEYTLKGNGDNYIVEKITHWSNNTSTTSTYDYTGSHSITSADFGEVITPSLDWTASALGKKNTTTAKTEEKKFSDTTKFVAVYSNHTHTATATNGNQSGTFTFNEYTPVVTFIDGDVEKTFPLRGYTIEDKGVNLSTTKKEVTRNSIAYYAYDYNYTISAKWDTDNPETLISKGSLLVVADTVGDAVYDHTQTWNNNTTTITVTKTIPHSHANDEVTTYETSVTISLKDLTNDIIYADNTSFNVTSSLTSENTVPSTDGYFTIKKRTRAYNYVLSNNAVSRTMSTEVIDAEITFNDGVYTKTFDVNLNLNHNGSFGTAYESGNYFVTPHTLSLTAKTVDNKTLTTKGITDIYVTKPEPTYSTNQTWSGNTTTVTVTKTTPTVGGSNKVENYKAEFTVSLQNLTNGNIYATNTAFDVTRSLVRENTTPTTNGNFTIKKRTRAYDYVLSNGLTSRTMPTEVIDAEITFNDGIYTKTFDVNLNLNHNGSFGQTYEDGNYNVTPHTLNLSAKTIDNKTLTTQGITNIYVEIPEVEPEYPHLGKPKGFTVTATFDPEHKVTRRAFCFNWEDGVTYAVCDYETMLPGTDDFMYKVDSYTQYNSVGYNKNNPSDPWEPARGTDNSDFIIWYNADGTMISGIDKAVTCKSIGWKNIIGGKYSLVIEGYTYTIHGYNITVIAPNGEKVTFNSHYNQ